MGLRAGLDAGLPARDQVNYADWAIPVIKKEEK
jgi:hypothetical protein